MELEQCVCGGKISGRWGTVDKAGNKHYRVVSECTDGKARALELYPGGTTRDEVVNAWNDYGRERHGRGR